MVGAKPPTPASCGRPLAVLHNLAAAVPQKPRTGKGLGNAPYSRPEGHRRDPGGDPAAAPRRQLTHLGLLCRSRPRGVRTLRTEVSSGASAPPAIGHPRGALGGPRLGTAYPRRSPGIGLRPQHPTRQLRRGRSCPPRWFQPGARRRAGHVTDRRRRGLRTVAPFAGRVDRGRRRSRRGPVHS